MMADMSGGALAGRKDLVGQDLDGRYRVVAPLGAGAMGQVYRGLALADSAPVAIKVLRHDLGDDADVRERFQREGQALFGLSHPHLLHVIDFGLVDGMPYLVMELLEGCSLDRLTEQGPLAPDRALRLAEQMLEGLAFAHRHGVVHRDLKSENIFIANTPEGTDQVKLLDFGLVKFTDAARWGHGRQLTVMGQVFGSPAYMAPEQCTGEPTDARSDVYSAGVILFEMLTGQWPFMVEEDYQMMQAHMTAPVPALAATRGGLVVRPELDALIARAMAKRREDRFGDGAETLAALRAIGEPRAYMEGAVPAQPAPTAGGKAAPSPAVLPPTGRYPAQADAGRAPSNGQLWVIAGAVFALGVLVLAGAVALVLFGG